MRICAEKFTVSAGEEIIYSSENESAFLKKERPYIYRRVKLPDNAGGQTLRIEIEPLPGKTYYLSNVYIGTSGELMSTVIYKNI